MKNKLKKTVSVFCVLAIVITAFAAVGRNVKAEMETQTEYTEEEIENQFLELLTAAGFNMYVSVQEDINGNYKISFGSDNPGYYEFTLAPAHVDAFMKSSDNINPMLGEYEPQTFNENFERDFLNPFVATDSNIHMVWQENLTGNFEIYYVNDAEHNYETTLRGAIEKLNNFNDKNTQKGVEKLNAALDKCLEQDYKHSIDRVHQAVNFLEKNKESSINKIIIASLLISVGVFAKTNILYAEYNITFNNTYVREAYEKYNMAIEKYKENNYDAAIKMFKNSYLKLIEAYEENNEVFIGVDFGKIVRISYTDHDSVAPVVFLNRMISVSWMEVLPGENHVYYASSNNGVNWQYYDATVYASSYLELWGMDSAIEAFFIGIIIGIIIIIISIIIYLILLLITLIILALKRIIGGIWPGPSPEPEPETATLTADTTPVKGEIFVNGISWGGCTSD